MRVLAWSVGLPVAVLVILFAVSNRQPIAVGLWPFAEGVVAPAYVVALVPLAIGFLLGGGLAGVGTVRARMRHRAERRKVRAIERSMDELRARSRPGPVPSVAALAAPPAPPPAATTTDR